MGFIRGLFKFLRFCFAILCAVAMSTAWTGWFSLFISVEDGADAFTLFWLGVAVITCMILYLTAQHGRLAFGRCMAYAAGMGLTGLLPSYFSDGMTLLPVILAGSVACAFIAWRALKFTIAPDLLALDMVSSELKHLHGFSNHYRKTVEPWMLEQEEKRRKVVPRMWIGICLTMPLATLATGAVALYIFPLFGWLDFMAADNEDPGMTVLAIFFGIMAFAGGAFAAYPYLSLQSEIKEKLLNKLLEFFEGLSYVEDLKGFDCKIFRNAGLVEHYTKQELGEAFTGQHAGIKFKVLETELEKITGSGKNREEETIFDGLMIVMSFSKSFDGHTLALRRGKRPALEGKKALEPVNLVHNSFENLYDVYSSDQTEARAVLTPDLMWNMVMLGQTFSGKNRIPALKEMDAKTIRKSPIDMAFIGDNLLMTIEGANDPFEIGALDSSMADTARIARFAREVGLIYEIIDTLELWRKTRSG